MLDLKEAAHVAALGRLEFKPEELERMAEELSAILGHVEKLAQLDTEGVGADFAVLPGVFCPLREDEVHRPQARHSREDMLANAQATEDGYFLVPKVVDV